MKLYFNEASPFSRKVRVLARELRFEQHIEEIDTGLISPVRPNATVIERSPIGKDPVLVLECGTSVVDSRVICEHIDLVGNGSFFSRETDPRLRALRLQALADDAMTTAVATRYELAHRPEGLLWTEWIDKQKARISRTIDYFDRLTDSFPESPTIGEVTIGCLLGYIDFRTVDESWRRRNPMLADWFGAFEQRPSMQATRPVS